MNLRYFSYCFISNYIYVMYLFNLFSIDLVPDCRFYFKSNCKNLTHIRTASDLSFNAVSSVIGATDGTWSDLNHVKQRISFSEPIKTTYKFLIFIRKFIEIWYFKMRLQNVHVLTWKIHNSWIWHDMDVELLNKTRYERVRFIIPILLW